MRVLAFLNLGAAGFATLPAVGEIFDDKLAEVDRAVAVGLSDPEHIRGVKIRFSRDALGSSDGWKMLERAKEIAERLAVPIMVHLAECPVPIGEVLAALRPGDIGTHLFHGGENGATDGKGKVLESVRTAAERGVLFDVGHGGWHFDIEVTRSLIAAGILPTTISTDAWAKTVWSGASDLPLYSLPALTSLFIGLGMGLEDALSAVTRRPAGILQRDDLGTVEIGAVADLAVLNRRAGNFTFRDRAGHSADVSVVLEPSITIRGGHVVEPETIYPFTKY
jgi:dihydroorotase